MPSCLQSLEAGISNVKEMKFDNKSFRIDINRHIIETTHYNRF